MKKQLLLLAACMMSFSCFAQTLSEKLNAYFDAANKAGIFNGSVRISKGNDVLINKGFGFKDVDAKSLNDANTIYQIGSVTKQFTSTLILKLAEQGKISLTDKLSKFFPDFPNADKITIEHLLSHTSGIYSYTNDTAFMMHEVEKPFSQQKLFTMIKDKPLEYEPGSQYRYNNSAYLLLGYIIEKVTGKKYESVVREQIFAPLGMNNSGFDFTHLTNTNRATGYNIIHEKGGTKTPIVDSTVSFSAGAIYSTVDDINKWNRSLSTEAILKKRSLDNAFTPRLSKYGLGWSIDTVLGKRVIAHGGGIHGFVSQNILIPSDTISITMLSNQGSSNMGQLTKDVYSILNNRPYSLPAKNKEITLKKDLLQQYVGEYELAPNFKITITLEGDALHGQATGQPRFELFAKSETIFFLKVVDAQVEFLRNDKGEVDQMILHQNGQRLPGKKAK